MAQYTVTIQMDPTTVDVLAGGGFVLGGLAGAQCPVPGLPALLFVTGVYGLTTTVSVEPAYLAYATAKPATAGSVVEIVPGAYAVAPGQTLQVAGPAGTGTVLPSGTAGAITIANTTQTPAPSAGLAVAPGAVVTVVPPTPVPDATAVFSAPLPPAPPLVVTPLPLLFLVFWVPSGSSPQPGVAMDTSPGTGVLIDLGTNPSPVLTYSATPEENAGWSWTPAQGGITAYGVGQALPPLLNPPVH